MPKTIICEYVSNKMPLFSLPVKHWWLILNSGEITDIYPIESDWTDKLTMLSKTALNRQLVAS